MLNKVSRSERKTPYNFSYMWNGKNEMKKQTKQKQTHRHRAQADG